MAWTSPAPFRPGKPHRRVLGYREQHGRRHDRVSAAANVIASSSTAGVQIFSANANVVDGNYIGTNSATAQNLGNTTAIQIFNSSNNVIGSATTGAGNTIGFNSTNGISVLSGSQNTINENTYFGSYQNLTPPETNDIGLGPNANNSQPAPSLISASWTNNQLSVLLTDSGPTVPIGTSVVVDLYQIVSTSPTERRISRHHDDNDRGHAVFDHDPCDDQLGQ